MTSLTGSKGFTLVEVMVASCVLVLGVVFIYAALFNCLNAYGYYRDYLLLAPWLDEKIWQSQSELTFFGKLLQQETSGELENKNRKFSWKLSYSQEGEKSGLFKINLDVSWLRGGRRRDLSRTAYALFAEQ